MVAFRRGFRGLQRADRRVVLFGQGPQPFELTLRRCRGDVSGSQFGQEGHERRGIQHVAVAFHFRLPLHRGRALDALERGARGTENLMTLIVEAVNASVTLGEICDRLRAVFGVHQPSVTF